MLAVNRSPRVSWKYATSIIVRTPRGIPNAIRRQGTGKYRSRLRLVRSVECRVGSAGLIIVPRWIDRSPACTSAGFADVQTEQLNRERFACSRLSQTLGLLGLPGLSDLSASSRFLRRCSRKIGGAASTSACRGEIRETDRRNAVRFRRSR